MSVKSGRLYARLLGGAAVLALSAGAAWADPANFNIAPQPLSMAVNAFSEQSGRAVLLKPELADKLNSPGVSGSLEPQIALAQMLQGTGLTYRQSGDTFLIEASDPQSGSAAGDGAGTVEALIVTAQKKEEQIQDVPIAISAFTEKSLEEQKIEGGFDLLKAIPNVTFSKNNFTSYNFSIRGIGTKAVSATTDPGVAVSFNNIALIQNRLFEQEYFDIERVEVLRGPQGTLYGRNATAGVINVISAKPNMREFDGWIKGEVGNYHTKRVSAMVNVPLIEDKLAIRFAGALTDRQGYDYNSVTKNHVNGRDLWSGRLTLAFNPTERLRTDLVWERFNEDDNRSRTGKQLCHRDPGPQVIGNTAVIDDPNVPLDALLRPAMFSQGCKPGSLYDDSAFGTPNGLALPFVFAPIALQSDCGPDCAPLFRIGAVDGAYTAFLKIQDPYGGMMQSRDLRTIASFRDPKYRAKADVVELNLDFDITDALRFSSQTAYDADSVYSFQDFNRFNTLPVFQDTSKLTASVDNTNPSPWVNVAPGGVFCDPQLGCSNTLAGFDISQAKSKQFTQEFRLESSFAGPVNFALGADYTKFKVLVDYYVMFNLISAFAMMAPFQDSSSGIPTVDMTTCYLGTLGSIYTPAPRSAPLSLCPYIDPNPVESIDGEGHNYFRSKNPYKLSSSAAFGELYWQASPDLKLTLGLRYTDDRKNFIPVPSQILLAPFFYAGGTVAKGYPEDPAIKQHWGEFTGRANISWTPKLDFTDQTMVYASYARGYKGGGANPPTPGFASEDEAKAQMASIGFDPSFLPASFFPFLKLTGVEYGPTFKPEFVNAFEVGTKNTLMGGAVVFNSDAFLYDYKDYQVSQIRDRTAVNENFDAKVWGLEFETIFAASRDLRFNANLGYLDTRIADGMSSIDIMNRTAGRAGYTVVKPWLQLPSNCVVPTPVVERYLQTYAQLTGYWNLCGGVGGLLGLFGSQAPIIDPATNALYDYRNYPELNGGAGIKTDLSGKELPNSPHWTMNVGAQYSLDFGSEWRGTIRADGYWQSQSWARVYNLNPYDKLHGWYNVNLSVWLERPEDDLKIEFYAKNILDKTPITDAFLNSDDTALTTNVFTLDPRLIGLSIHKGF